MADVTIYHNPRCSKSREALALLEGRGVSPRVVKYLETPLTAPQLDALTRKLGIEPSALMRTGEDLYAELGLEGRMLSRAEALAILAEHPRLIERPIIETAERAVVGRPPERALTVL